MPEPSSSPRPARDVVFYDGECGFCHATVKFVLERDARHAFDFAPLGGETFTRLVPPEQRASVPDSVLVLTTEGALLDRSRATAYELARLRTPWPLVARLMKLVPRPLIDAAYDAFAKRRRRLMKKPEAACPLVAPALRSRFLA